MVAAAILAITLDPALRVLFTRMRSLDFRPGRMANAALVGRIRAEESHPVSGALIRIYEPVVSWSLRRKWAVIGGAAVLVLATLPLFWKLGSEFMPPLDEGPLLYMPPPCRVSPSERRRHPTVHRRHHQRNFRK